MSKQINFSLSNERHSQLLTIQKAMKINNIKDTLEYVIYEVYRLMFDEEILDNMVQNEEIS